MMSSTVAARIVAVVTVEAADSEMTKQTIMVAVEPAVTDVQSKASETTFVARAAPWRTGVLIAIAIEMAEVLKLAESTRATRATFETLGTVTSTSMMATAMAT